MNENTNTHVGNIAAAPALGNFTSDAIDHVQQASALATSIVGEGFEVFSTWNPKIQHDLLWLLASELRRAQKAIEAEAEELQSSIGAHSRAAKAHA